MLSSHHRLIARLMLAVSIWFGAAATAFGDPYYTLTDLGGLGVVTQQGQQYVNNQTGATTPFPITDGTLPESDYASRPGVTGILGATYPTTTFFPMTITDYNSAGTVIGGVPSGSSRALPYSALTMGYAVVSSQGQWSSFTPLSSGYNGLGGLVQLSSLTNQILVVDAFGSRLVNAADGSSTPISQLVAPSVLAQFSNLTGQAIDDHGDILAIAVNSNGNDEYVLLSPPGVAAAPIPEPTALATLTLAAVGIAFRRRLRKSRRPG